MILLDPSRSSRGFSRVGALFRCPQLFADAQRTRLVIARQLYADRVAQAVQKQFWYAWEKGDTSGILRSLHDAGYEVGDGRGDAYLVDDDADDVAHHADAASKRGALVRGSLGHMGLAHWYAAIGAAQGGVLISAECAKAAGLREGSYDITSPPGMEACALITDPAAFLPPEDAMSAWCSRHPEGEAWLPLMLNSVRGYSRRWTDDAAKFRVLAVECEHRLELGALGDVQSDEGLEEHPEFGEPLYYTARLDLEESTGSGATLQVWSVDHKHTGRITSKHSSYYSIHGQFSGHRVIGAKTWGARFGDVVLNLVENTGEHWSRPDLEPSPGLTRSFLGRVRRAESYRARLELQTIRGELDVNEWPAAMNELTCYHRYGKCPSWDRCRWGGG